MCNCIAQIDAILEPRGERLELVQVVDLASGKFKRHGIPIMTESVKTGARKKNRSMCATYCPFCGKTDEESAEESASVTA